MEGRALERENTLEGGTEVFVLNSNEGEAMLYYLYMMADGAVSDNEKNVFSTVLGFRGVRCFIRKFRNSSTQWESHITLHKCRQ